MMTLLPLAFAEPLLLIALLALPALYWLLRLRPPPAQRIVFPPTQLLRDIAPKEETPAHIPWWLLALRLGAAALVILAAAGPILNPPPQAAHAARALVLLIDDGWSAAASWDFRLRAADALIAGAEQAGQPVALVPLSEPTRDISLQSAASARGAMRQLGPTPHAIDRAAILPALTRWLTQHGEVNLVWLSDSTLTGNRPTEADTFLAGLNQLGQSHALTIYDHGAPGARALGALDNAPSFMAVKVLRAPDAPAHGLVRARDRKGAVLGEAPFSFEGGASLSEARIDLPASIRNDIARLEIVGERAAGAVRLVDRRWARRSIGIVSGTTHDQAQPLLAATYYLARALRPFADIHLAERIASTQAITQFLDAKIPVIVLADVGSLPDDLRERLMNWIEQGGVLIRFAGPRLAASQDSLVPVRLREGGRTLGGALTWEKPQKLASFAANGPFAGLAVPDDVTITRQVLAEPDERLAARSWAALADGTPLVTGERRGRGALVLFHVNANTRWSNLPLSGTFVEMLRRLGDLGSATPAAMRADNADPGSELLPPRLTLNGFGEAGAPHPQARPLDGPGRARADRDHPPGFYGPAGAPLTLNTLAPEDRLLRIDTGGLNGAHRAYRDSEPRELRGLLLALALALFALDALAALWLSGRLARLRLRARRPSAALTLAVLILAAGAVPGFLARPGTALAQSTFGMARDSAPANDPLAITRKTRLAYVVTGDAETDEITRAGLSGLTLFLAQRTALEGGEPVGIDPARDELAFYPLIYWPVSEHLPTPPRAAMARIEAYMKQGGTVLFDTRDAIETLQGENGLQSGARANLRAILAALDVPALEPVPREHVLTKTFYLLRDFPGRFTSGRLWVEALPRGDNEEEDSERPARSGDGVSSIIITSNDLVGAWALRPDGQPMLPLIPDEPRQREMAFRAGVNIVMYTLTGNYKADQVHAPALIERLGQ